MNVNLFLGPITLAVISGFAGYNFSEHNWDLMTIEIIMALWLAWKLEQRFEDEFAYKYKWTCPHCEMFKVSASSTDFVEKMRRDHLWRNHPEHIDPVIN